MRASRASRSPARHDKTWHQKRDRLQDIVSLPLLSTGFLEHPHKRRLPRGRLPARPTVIVPSDGLLLLSEAVLEAGTKAETGGCSRRSCMPPWSASDSCPTSPPPASRSSRSSSWSRAAYGLAAFCTVFRKVQLRRSRTIEPTSPSRSAGSAT